MFPLPASGSPFQLGSDVTPGLGEAPGFLYDPWASTWNPRSLQGALFLPWEGLWRLQGTVSSGPISGGSYKIHFYPF